MSALSMVTIGVSVRKIVELGRLTKIQVFSGNMQDSHTYLAESEALIRNYGLPKPVKSQKVSKLHHIFSFLRIIHESTSLRGNKATPKSNHIWGSTECGITQNNSGVSNDIAESASSRLAWVEDDEGEDVEDSLFVSIYQLPTTLLSLLSQTSSLCKQLQSSESTTPEFARRCQISKTESSDGKPLRLSVCQIILEVIRLTSTHLVLLQKRLQLIL
jgi:arginine metabolism regulation protein II